MRHRRLKGKLSVATDHREAMLRSLASSLIIHQRIKTTKANAKELRRFIEPLITLAKNDGFNSRRRAASLLSNPEAVRRLFKDVAPLFKERHGGYTRIIKLGQRKGDGASIALIELTEKKITKEPKPEAAKRVKPPKTIKEVPKERQTGPETKPKPTVERTYEKLPPKKEKPSKGFFEGLRKIFRRKV